MRLTTKIALGAAASLLATLALAPAAQAKPRETYGCPYGAVCLYPRDRGWNNSHPSYVFWSYGPHNLTGQWGDHFVFNNQYGGAKVTLDKGYGGSNPVFTINAFSYTLYNLSPIDSVTLVR